MGNSNKKPKNVSDIYEKIQREKAKIETVKTKKEIERQEKTRKDKIKYDLNIYIYSNNKIKNYLTDIIRFSDNEAFNWKINIIEGGFSNDNSNTIIKSLKDDFDSKTFKNCLLIPINSISDFEKSVECDGKNILEHFNMNLINEQQPFFLLIDSDENDFVRYENIDEVTLETIFEFKRKEIDFEISVDIILKNKVEELDILKNLLLDKKKNKDDFEIRINEIYNYQIIFGEENIELLQFIQIFEDKNIEIFKISILSFNQNTPLIDEFNKYQLFKDDSLEIKIIYFEFKKEKIQTLLNKYTNLDQRNFNIIRERKSPKFQLIKYAGYYNQFGDILFSDQTSCYPAKLNIAVGGFIGSGKSTLINTILGEKRCLEGQGCSITNYISHYTLKDYPLNFIDFPGFGAKQGDMANTLLFVNDIKNKMEEMKKINEVIHCFLFCIKYEERIFDEKDNDMIKVFDIIIKLQIKTFFIITQSEKSDTYEFKRFKTNLINGIKQVEKKYKNKDLLNKVFGENLENQIIPIFALKKRLFGHNIKPFGLDNLFSTLYGFFLNKKISDFLFILNFGLGKFVKKDDLKEWNVGTDNEIQKLIDNNELLKCFESKESFLNGLRQKCEGEISKSIFKIFLIAPKYIYLTKGIALTDLFYTFLNEIFYRLLTIYKFSIDNESNYDVIIKRIIERDFGIEEVKKMEIDEKERDEVLKQPLFLKILFPIISPLYYLLGGSVLGFFINKISKKIADSFVEEVVDQNFYLYFKRVIESFNKAIDSLEEISKNFEISYSEG